VKITVFTNESNESNSLTFFIFNQKSNKQQNESDFLCITIDDMFGADLRAVSETGVSKGGGRLRCAIADPNARHPHQSARFAGVFRVGRRLSVYVDQRHVSRCDVRFDRQGFDSNEQSTMVCRQQLLLEISFINNFLFLLLLFL
jgi:hypothetical protein